MQREILLLNQQFDFNFPLPLHAFVSTYSRTRASSEGVLAAKLFHSVEEWLLQ